MDNKDLFINRIHELHNRSMQNYYPVYSHFLNLNEISILKNEFKYSSNYELYGGYKNADRKVVAFYDNQEKLEFPISIIHILPFQKKFSDNLSHRDFLGAIMNLGIERNTIGDIITIENEAYVFVLNNIKDYIIDNLFRIKHTSIKIIECDIIPDILLKEPEPQELIISSLRLDVLISSVFKLSRKESNNLINNDKVFINSSNTNKNSILLNENDIVSVRGYGKFIFNEELHKTKKGNSVVSISIYK